MTSNVTTYLRILHALKIYGIMHSAFIPNTIFAYLFLAIFSHIKGLNLLPYNGLSRDTLMLSKLISGLFITAGLSAFAAEKPNIVFILADDMGYDSVSANNPAMGRLKTPHIDRLISEGINFTDAHSGSAVCTPTRYGLLTGRYCWRSRLKDQVLWEYGNPLIEEGRLTLPQFLSDNGYTTGMIGKWHLGLSWFDSNGNPANASLNDKDSYFKNAASKARIEAVEKAIDFSQATKGGPTDRGFDEWLGMDAPNFPPYGWMRGSTLEGSPDQAKPENMFGHPGPMVTGWKLERILQTLGNESANWIKEKANNDQPFFLYVSLTSPHTPIAPSPSWKGKSGISPYADFLLETDAVVGQIVTAINATGSRDNTLIVFTADNGTAHFARFDQLNELGIDLRYHFRGHKASIHEGGHRVPFVVSWPGKTPVAKNCNEVVCLNDFFATVADLLKVALPDDAAEDSTSILPLITGASDTLPGRPAIVNHDYNGMFAIREGPWKLIASGKNPLLYNLANDPKEEHNLAKENPERVEKLTNTLKHYKASGRSR